MIVGGDAIEVLSPVRFLMYMIFPSVAVFLITILWIERCWMRNRLLVSSKLLSVESDKAAVGGASDSLFALDTRPATKKRKDASRRGSILSPYKKESSTNELSHDFDVSQKKTKSGIVGKVVRVIITPFPYAMLLLMAIMIAMIFVDVMSISGLICLTAVIMVIILVLGNHWYVRTVYYYSLFIICMSACMPLICEYMVHVGVSGKDSPYGE